MANVDRGALTQLRSPTSTSSARPPMPDSRQASSAATHKTNACEAKDHHRPSGELGDRRSQGERLEGCVIVEASDDSIILREEAYIKRDRRQREGLYHASSCVREERHHSNKKTTAK